MTLAFVTEVFWDAKHNSLLATDLQCMSSETIPDSNIKLQYRRSTYMHFLLMKETWSLEVPFYLLAPASNICNYGVSNETFIAITDIHFLFYLIINDKPDVFE